MIPQKTFMPGWPDQLTDNAGNRFVRLRDGKPTSEYGGETCLYGLVKFLGLHGLIDRAHQWIPNLGATERDMTLTGGTWSSAEELEAYGQTSIVIPPEPVEWPV